MEEKKKKILLGLLSNFNLHACLASWDTKGAEKGTFIEDINDTVIQGLFLQPSKGTRNHGTVMRCGAVVPRSKTDEEQSPAFVTFLLFHFEISISINYI